MTNVPRGLFRLWVVVSVLWVIGAGSVAWLGLQRARHLSVMGTEMCDSPELVFDSVANECIPEWLLRLDPDVRASVAAQNRRDALGYAALVGLLPPIIVLIIVLAVRCFYSHPPSAS
jgi:hypothetical protein